VQTLDLKAHFLPRDSPLIFFVHGIYIFFKINFNYMYFLKVSRVSAAHN